MKKLLIAILIFVPMLTQAQNSGGYWKYNIEYSNEGGHFPDAVSLGQLFPTDVTLDVKSAKGNELKTVLTKKTWRQPYLTLLLNTTANGKKLLQTVLKFEIKDDEESALLVYLKVSNLVSGEITESEIDGTDVSEANTAGVFLGVSTFLADVNKLGFQPAATYNFLSK